MRFCVPVHIPVTSFVWKMNSVYFYNCMGNNIIYIWQFYKRSGRSYDPIFATSISDVVYGSLRRPVRLGCEDNTANGHEELEWRYDYHRYHLVARGIYVDGTLTNAVFYSPLASGRTEFTLDGSLIIHNYVDRDAGVYLCHSEHRSTLLHLTSFGMWGFIMIYDSGLLW